MKRINCTVKGLLKKNVHSMFRCMIDPSPLSADDYRNLLARREWTHARAAKALGISLRTSKIYAQNGVPEGLASVALRSLLKDQEPEPLRLQKLETWCARVETSSFALAKRAERAEHRLLTAERALRQTYAALLRGDAMTAQNIVAMRLDDSGD